MKYFLAGSLGSPGSIYPIAVCRVHDIFNPFYEVILNLEVLKLAHIFPRWPQSTTASIKRVQSPMASVPLASVPLASIRLASVRLEPYRMLRV